MKTFKINVPDKISTTEQVSQHFLQGMADRMSMGYFNYGPVKDNFPHNYDAIKSMQQRLKKYRKDHNTEWLMDAANYLMIEFMFPKDSKAFFEPTTKRESPGATLRNGKISKGKEDFDPESNPLQRVLKTKINS